MNREHLIERLKQIFQSEVKINIDNIDPDAELTTLDIDSLDILKVAAAVEKSFDIKISTNELAEIRTFANMIDRLESKVDLKQQWKSHR
jgi:acyl carrier protein